MIFNRFTAARAVATGVFALALAGCAGQQARHNAELDTVLESGSYRDAALMAESRMGFKAAPDPDIELPPVRFQARHVLTHLEAAEAWRLAGNLDRAILHFDAAEAALGDLEDNAAGRAAGKAGAALVNESMASYVPSPSESVLINYYKALAFWSRGEQELARVELNRSDDRTRRAVERYSREIEAAQKEASSKGSNQTYDNPEVAGQINSNFPEMAQWAPYAEFVVPPATYLQALFLARSGVPSDYEKAAELLQRLGGIVGEHPALDQDRESLESGAICPDDDCIWVLVERGRGPELVERKFSYPVFTGSSIVNVQLALPALASRFDPVFQQCRISYEGIEQPCAPFASMDRVVQTEFQKRFPGIVTRSIVSAAVKAVAQDQVAQRAGLLGGLLAAVVTDAATTADVRMWRSMPGDFTLNRVRRNGSSEIELDIGPQRVQLALEQPGSQLVHVKALVPHLPPVVTLVDI